MSVGTSSSRFSTFYTTASVREQWAIGLQSTIRLKKRKKETKRKGKKTFTLLWLVNAFFYFLVRPRIKRLRLLPMIFPLSLSLLRLGYIFDTYYVRVSNLFTVVPSQQLNNRILCKSQQRNELIYSASGISGFSTRWFTGRSVLLY